MGTIDRLLPAPRSVELDFVDLAAPPDPVWERIRHGALPLSPLARALFAIRTLPDRLADRASAAPLVRLDDLRSTPGAPGFGILAEGEREAAIGAIGKVWMPDIPFVHSADAEAFRAFAEPDYLKIAWALRVLPHGDGGSRVEFELRTEATDEGAWEKFRRYFLVIGPASHLIRRSLLRALAREYGGPGAHEDDRALEGDELLPDAAAQITHSVSIAARPEQVWPWLVQMGCRRGGFYSVDALDNGGERSAREVHPELQHLAVGDVIAATPEGRDGFEVLALARAARAGAGRAPRRRRGPPAPLRRRAPRALLARHLELRAGAPRRKLHPPPRPGPRGVVAVGGTARRVDPPGPPLHAGGAAPGAGRARRGEDCPATTGATCSRAPGAWPGWWGRSSRPSCAAPATTGASTSARPRAIGLGTR